MHGKKFWGILIGGAAGYYLANNSDGGSIGNSFIPILNPLPTAIGLSGNTLTLAWAAEGALLGLLLAKYF